MAYTHTRNRIEDGERLVIQFNDLEGATEQACVWLNEIKRLESEVAKLRKVAEFGQRVAKAMLEIRSSNVFFIVQRAYGDEAMTWEDVEGLLADAGKGAE